MILRRVLLAVLLFLSTFTVGYAQQNWGGGVDDDPVHFGFTFQYVSTEFKILKKDNWRTSAPDPDTYYNLRSISSPPSSGFALGFVSNVRLGDHWDLRSTPVLVLTDRLLEYQYESPNVNTRKQVQSATIDVPLGFKLKSDRRRNFRAYFIAGVKYSVDIISKKKLNDSAADPYGKLVKNNRSILWYETGVGFDLYFEFFKLSPEIKLANSFTNVLSRKDLPNTYTTPLDKLFLRNLQFSLYFE